MDAADPDHEATGALITQWEGTLVVPAFVAAEADYLILTRLGVDVEVAFIHDLATAFQVESLDPAGLAGAAELCERYRDLELGLADAAIVVLAARLGTRSLATFDERDFRAITPLQGGAFELLPHDT